MTGIVIREYDFCYYFLFSNFTKMTIETYFNTLLYTGVPVLQTHYEIVRIKTARFI